MPGMSGVDTLHQLQEQGVESRVLVLPSSLGGHMMTQALQAGAPGLKTTRAAEMLQAIEQVALGTPPAGIEINLAGVVTLDPVITQGFIGCSRQDHPLFQTHLAPTLQPGLSEATEPAFVFPHQPNVRSSVLGPLHPPRSTLFFSRKVGRGWFCAGRRVASEGPASAVLAAPLGN
jgi:hypothetical protein